MSLNLLNNKTHKLRLQRGTFANLPVYHLEGEVAYCTDTKQFYISDGTNWLRCSGYFLTRTAIPNMGTEQNENVADVGLDYINSKKFTNVTFGAYDNTIDYKTKGIPVKGYLDAITGKWEVAIKSLADTAWRRLLAGVALRNDTTNKQLVTDDYVYVINLFNGDSQALDTYGTPIVQDGVVSMGAMATPDLISGGTF